MSQHATWIKLVTELSQIQKDKRCMVSLIVWNQKLSNHRSREWNGGHQEQGGAREMLVGTQTGSNKISSRDLTYRMMIVNSSVITRNLLKE